ncbi:nuclear transport factor 2 family protein [Aquirufa rosea]|uniref:Nuclear transport factor 2 family protein n=1 Tax=Aquirufa rosea TaxID=2509241 RepID=A0A4Q1BYZ2_9BACT|nr:nuclear transport factor 2 family protein [Aquirufa rosea]RXK48758.1 nuclear transport factor 2 family protein [Aquirufa rosea]
MKLFICLFLFGLVSHTALAQKSESKALYQQIAHLDSVMFQAYNQRDMATFKQFFTSDLEWFQDNGGLLHYDTVIANFQNIFNREYVLTRKLVPGTLEVHPIQNYGAIHIGRHTFSHVENGKLEVGEFKFLMIWREEQGKWKISRVVSYDH